MKIRLLVLASFLGLLFLPSSVHAQQNCSSITFQLQTGSTTAHDCSKFTTNPLGIPYTTTWNFSVTCYNTQSNVQYQNNPISLAGVGHCEAQISGAQVNCPPSWTWSKVTPTTAGTNIYNQLYLYAKDNDMTAGGSPCVQVDGAESFVQCPTQACAPKCFTGCGGSPIILDLNGKGFVLTDAANGVKFDLAGSGTPVQMGWTAPGADNAFLALPGADGLIHSGQQLFGNYTPQPPSTTPNGFAALAVYDDPKNGGNGDGIIDSRDAIFSSLRLWIDANHDGISQPDELHTLPSLGVNSISLTYKADERTDQWGNVFHYHAQVNPGDATSTGRIAYDVFFVEAGIPTAKNVIPIRIAVDDKCQVPDKKVGMVATGAGGSR